MEESYMLNLIKELKQFDNENGYRLSYPTVKKRLEEAKKKLIELGEIPLDYLHVLLGHSETWSCLFALEILKEIKSERSIPYLIEYIKNNEKGDYWGGCEDAMFALRAIGKPAINPLIEEIKELFKQKIYFPFLVGSLNGIKDDAVYSFMISITEDYLENTERYKGWFQIDDFTYEFTEHGNKNALVILKKLVDLDLKDEEKIEIKDTIEMLEDPEGFEKNFEELAKKIKPVFSTSKRKIGRNEPCHCGSGIKYKKCCMSKDIKETGKIKKVKDNYLREYPKMKKENNENEEDDLWEEGGFAETLGPKDIEERMKTFHKRHDEDMNFNCRKCNKKISAHNKDWHDGMCDDCFNKEYY